MSVFLTAEVLTLDLGETKMGRCLLTLSMLLGLGGTALGASAHWGEEMLLSPVASGWAVFDGNWGSWVEMGPGGTWIGPETSGYLRTTDATGHPLANLGSYTMEYKVRLRTELDTTASNCAITVYNGGPNTARSRTFFGFLGGPLEDDPLEPRWVQDYPIKYVEATYEMPALEWQVVRVVMDQAADTHKLFVNGVELISNPGGAPPLETDDPWLAFGSGDPVTMSVEYDYIRVYKGVLPISEPLNAVPEPSTLGLLGLGALGLLLRRKRR